MTVIVEAGSSLERSVWVPIATTMLAGGVFEFSEVQWNEFAHRFYRVVLR